MIWENGVFDTAKGHRVRRRAWAAGALERALFSPLGRAEVERGLRDGTLWVPNTCVLSGTGLRFLTWAEIAGVFGDRWEADTDFEPGEEGLWALDTGFVCLRTLR